MHHAPREKPRVITACRYSANAVIPQAADLWGLNSSGWGGRASYPETVVVGFSREEKGVCQGGGKNKPEMKLNLRAIEIRLALAYQGANRAFCPHHR
jgi:hypothetical protein